MRIPAQAIDAALLCSCSKSRNNPSVVARPPLFVVVAFAVCTFLLSLTHKTVKTLLSVLLAVATTYLSTQQYTAFVIGCLSCKNPQTEAAGMQPCVDFIMEDQLYVRIQFKKSRFPAVETGQLESFNAVCQA